MAKETNRVRVGKCGSHEPRPQGQEVGAWRHTDRLGREGFELQGSVQRGGEYNPTHAGSPWDLAT